MTHNIAKLSQNWASENTWQCRYEESTDSTNAWAKTDYKASWGQALYLAAHQSRGRGRYQRHWVNAPDGATLLSTWCLTLSSPPQAVAPIRVGLALFDAFTRTWPDRAFSLKAPNDVYLNSGKLAGILVEVEQAADIRAFIGIGANIFAAPQVEDQKTSYLCEPGSLPRDKWFEFCHYLSHNLLEIRKDAHRALLTNSERELLLAALKKHPGNQIMEITADGSLTLMNGNRIAWHDL